MKAFVEIGEPHRKAVAAIAGDLHSVQVLTVHPDAAEDTAAALAAITAAARAHQKRMPFTHNQARPGVLALPATKAGADRAAELGYADTIRRPATAVHHFEDGSWTLPPGGSLVIVDDADHLHPDLLKSLVEQSAVRTNTKLLLITTEHPDHGRDRGVDRTRGEGVAVLRDTLPWAQHIGTPTRNIERDTVIDRTRRHLGAAGRAVDSPVHAEAAELLARHTSQIATFRDEITARERLNARFTTRSRDRDRTRSRDDGLEL